MLFHRSRALRRSATVLLAAGILAAPAASAVAGAVGYYADRDLSPAGTRVTGDGHPWIGGPADGGVTLAGTRVTGGDGYPWVGRPADRDLSPAGTRVTVDGHPWAG